MDKTQTTLIDPRWYEKPDTMEEAQTRIDAMLRRLEEADKLLKKPDYDLVKKLDVIKIEDPKERKKLDEIIGEIKSRPISKKLKKPALWVVPHHHGRPNYREKKEAYFGYLQEARIRGLYLLRHEEGQ